MGLSVRHRPALVAFILCTFAFFYGCGVEAPEYFQELAMLREELINEFGHEDVEVFVQAPNLLVVSFVNSPFNQLPEPDKGRKAQEVAVFASNHFASISKLHSILVSFVTRETYYYIFQRNKARNYIFDKRGLVYEAVENMPAETVLKARDTYSESQKTTTVLVNNLQLYGNLNKGLILIPSFTVKAKKVVAPQWVELEFASYDERPRFADDHKIAVTVDGKLVASGDAQLVSSGKTAEGLASEFLMYRLTYRQFLAVIDGREVELKLGAKTISLTAEHLSLLREMKECIDASKCK